MKEFLKEQNLDSDAQMSKLRALVESLLVENQGLRGKLMILDPKMKNADLMASCLDDEDQKFLNTQNNQLESEIEKQISEKISHNF